MCRIFSFVCSHFICILSCNLCVEVTTRLPPGRNHLKSKPIKKYTQTCPTICTKGVKKVKFDMAVKMFAEKHDITDSIQLQAIQLVMEGLPYNQIAEILGFKSKNCERIIRNILTKVGLNRPHARYEIMSEIYQISKGISEMDTLQK